MSIRKTILETDSWYHIVALYNGMDILVFINGELEGYAAYSGKINTTSYDLVIGQSLPSQEGFNYRGLMDNLHIYNYGITYEKVQEIYDNEKVDIFDLLVSDNLRVYPNPVKGSLNFELKTKPGSTVEISLHSITGQKIYSVNLKANNEGNIWQRIDLTEIGPGSYILKSKTEEGISVRKIIIGE